MATIAQTRSATPALRGIAPHAAAVAVFALAAAATLWSARAMAATMPMPGGWRMSMMWMRMPQQSWPAAAAVFIAMWAAMMVAMMLPSTLPMLLLYRRVVAVRGGRQPAFAVASAPFGYV